MALTDAALKAAKPGDRPYKIGDKDGLYAYVTPAGGISWRYNYIWVGKQKTVTFGRYPAVPLREARRRLLAAKAQIGAGVDPAAAKAAVKAPVDRGRPTFEEAARSWHEVQLPRWTEKYGDQVLTRLEADVFPHLGRKRFAEIGRVDILECLRLVEDRGVLETARRLRQYVGAIHRFAGAEDDSITDPTPMLRGALKAPKKGRHHKRMPFDKMGGFLRRLDTYETEYEGEAVTRLAIRFTVLCASRTCETINAEWSQFTGWRDGKDALWRVPEGIMKMDDPHTVPLSRQACALLRELHDITGKRRFLFPQPFGRERPMSNNCMLFAVYRLGFRGRSTMHGMRAVFSTWANEARGNRWDADDVELCLAHDERDESRAAYNAARRLPERRVLLQAWADALDEAKRGAETATLIG